ncbi:MAG: hypothetical protein ACKPCM_08615 [Pseudanabaena sp.]
MEMITIPKTYSNREIAEILGCAPETVRQVKSRKADQLEGLWSQDGSSETVWTEEGLEKLAELINTEKSQQFRASALARRTQEAIAVDRAELYQNDIENSSTRTGHETAEYTINKGRYSQLPEKIGGAIAGQMVNDGAIERIDKAVVSELLRSLNLGDDIDIETLLG